MKGWTEKQKKGNQQVEISGNRRYHCSCQDLRLKSKPYIHPDFPPCGSCRLLMRDQVGYLEAFISLLSTSVTEPIPLSVACTGALDFINGMIVFCLKLSVLYFS